MPPTLDQVTIGIVTALRRELAAAKQVFNADVIAHAEGTGAGRKYWLSELQTRAGGFHTIAIASLTQTGNNYAAIRATQLLEHCKNARGVIMCGIAAAVPNPDTPAEHVRLGDIVVSDSPGVIQYDSGKEGPEGRIAPSAGGYPPSAAFLEAVYDLQTDYEYKSQRPWETYITEACDSSSCWARPAESSDRLLRVRRFAWMYRHLPLRYVDHPKDLARRSGCPRVFLGPIASGNVVQRNPRKRDRLREQHGVKAIEMEASGISDAAHLAEKRYLIIRGTCDYADPGKNKVWQDYAALCAAAYARAVVESTPVPLSGPRHLSVAATVQFPDALGERLFVQKLDRTVQQAGSIAAPQPANPKSSPEHIGKITLELPIAVGERPADSKARKEVCLNRPPVFRPLPDETVDADLLEKVQRLLRLIDNGDFEGADAAAQRLETDLQERYDQLSQQARLEGFVALAKVEKWRLRIHRKKTGDVVVDTSKLNEYIRKARSERRKSDNGS